MGRGIQCDRCKTFEVAPAPPTHMRESWPAFPGWTQIWTGETIAMDRPKAHFCPDCSKEFEAFVMGVPIATVQA